MNFECKGKVLCSSTNVTFASIEWEMTFLVCVLSTLLTGRNSLIFSAGRNPQVAITGHSKFAQKQCKNSLNSADRTRVDLKYIFSENIFFWVHNSSEL